MAAYCPLAVFALLASVLQSIVISQQKSCVVKSVYYVSSRTGADSEDCLRPDQRDHPCASLSYLKDNIHQCATMKLMDDLLLNNTVLVLNSKQANIRIEGMSSMVTISCRGDSGVVLQDVVDITLANLTFNGCSFSSSKYYLGAYGPLNRTSVILHNTSDTCISHCSFVSQKGSALLLLDIHGNTIIENSFFQGSRVLLDQHECRSGGIVLRSSHVASNSSLSISSCYFDSNLNDPSVFNLKMSSCESPIGYGGALDILIGPLEDNTTNEFLITSSSFHNNMALCGGAISVRFKGNFHQTIIAIDQSIFTNNKAGYEGGALYFTNEQPTNEITLITPIRVNESHFTNNTGALGGAVSVLVLCKDCSGLLIEFTSCKWQYNRAEKFGNALYLIGTVAYFGGVTKLELNGANTVAGLGTILASNSLVLFAEVSSELTGNMGTALVLLNTSQAHISGNVTFHSNIGIFGGAILIEDESHAVFSSLSTIIFLHNTAWVLGGAIFSRVTGTFCGILILEDSEVIFENNLANRINQSVAIKNSKKCMPTEVLLKNYSYVPDSHTQILIDNGEISLVPDSLEVMLGQMFTLKPHHISLQNVGYLRLWTEKHGYSLDVTLRGPSTVAFDDYNSNIEFFIQGQNITKNTTFYIRFFYEDSQYYHMGQANVSVYIVPCRVGYRYDKDKQICVCSSKSDKVMCLSSGRDLCVQRHYWYSDRYDSAFPCPVQNCWYMYGRCPDKAHTCPTYSNYCSIKESDDLCWNGRSGLLCSRCAANHSFTYSAFECAPSTTCSARSTGLLVLALFVYWVLAVFAILVVLSLNLSVGSGFMYGIIYFFSISMIYTKQSSLFSDLWIRITLYIDMAITWLDTELIGFMIKLCFAKSWDNALPHYLFRFTTPLFIICVIVVVVLIPRYIKLPRRLSFAENSPIHAICMLILISYTSVACTSFKLLVPLSVNGTLRVQIAPEVFYFKNEHIPYAIIAIFLQVFLSLPICILFLFANQISKYINLVKFRLKPIVDEFQACYRPECCWFAGFYFLARLVIFFISEISLDQPQDNTVLTTVNIVIVIIHTSFQPYKEKWLNVLDTILLMDIVFLSLMKPESIDEYGRIDRAFHDNIIPFFLVIIPTLALFGTILFIFYKKFHHIFRRCSKRLSVKLPWSKGVSSRASTITEDNSRSNDGNNRSLRRVNSYTALREPLLDDSYEERDSHRTTYQTEVLEAPQTHNTQPYRLSQYTTRSFRMPATD